MTTGGEVLIAIGIDIEFKPGQARTPRQEATMSAPTSAVPRAAARAIPQKLAGGALHVAGWGLMCLGWIVLVLDRAVLSVPELSFLDFGLIGSGLVGGFIPLCFVAGSALIIRVRKLAAVDAAALMEEDTRAPVLYLRSFGDDGEGVMGHTSRAQGFLAPTVEEKLAAAMRHVRPFVAIGRPGEALPELGAARMYVSDERWQDEIIALMERARIVLLRIGDTPGFWWEVRQVMERVEMARVVFFFPPGTDHLYPRFRQMAGEQIGALLPEDIGAAQFLYLDTDGTPHFVEPRFSGVNRLGNSAVDAMYLAAFRPIFERIGLKPPKPPFPLVYKLVIGLAILGITAGLLSIYATSEASKSRAIQAKSQIHAIEQVIEQYRINTGRLPEPGTGLCASLPDIPRGTRCRDGDPLDPWGRPYKYDQPGGRNPG